MIEFEIFYTSVHLRTSADQYTSTVGRLTSFFFLKILTSITIMRRWHIYDVNKAALKHFTHCKWLLINCICSLLMRIIFYCEGFLMRIRSKRLYLAWALRAQLDHMVLMVCYIRYVDREIIYQTWCKCFCCWLLQREKSFPFVYLGCPIYARRKKICYFDTMVTKVVKRPNANSGW